MGYAAARFGHVMFPENVYEPALECAELLLDGVGKGYVSMHDIMHLLYLECILARDTETFANKSKENVLARQGSYHGDTLGAMEAQAPSSYTGFLQQPWYTGRGLFLDPPTVFMHNGKWTLSLPEPSGLVMKYSLRAGTTQILLACIHLIQGAGGMHMVDPLFQRMLVNESQHCKIPVIFDEVFTGFWRLGVEAAAELLGCVPDIACFAKLMTGGIISLATTLATDAVFDSFTADSKLKALLHGHSYSAHAMGCTAAARSIKWFKDPITNLNITSKNSQKILQKILLRELWDAELVQQISLHPSVSRVVALGTLFALELQADGSDGGYASLYARSLVQMLREDGIYCRPLGNVIYVMSGPCTSPAFCTQQLLKLYTKLEEFTQGENQAFDSVARKMQRLQRYMTRSNSIARGKRSLEGYEDQEPEPKPKRPALASVIVEALKVDSLQKLCSSLEPILRRVVRPISYSL
ncbi:Bifunctional dethiobiotin synthetase/7,8-diamino-pelargonic acid aminotransferase [Hibiscus syriacus]|uniref:Bifunctional dethiobiotin synthetase/7,8-diamino-pelargonic acid aminotransferase n=1 Tax=Hibiscus syriacus TaxID=106335 RepID=A0A6A3B7Q4_HIBSY|nr:Bifunctional dethiobiotin synthetase/7,8-diamino-pelargonic acid aminotransferase [Hibiscus syriacus]